MNCNKNTVQKVELTKLFEQYFLKEYRYFINNSSNKYLIIKKIKLFKKYIFAFVFAYIYLPSN